MDSLEVDQERIDMRDSIDSNDGPSCRIWTLQL